MDEEVLRAMATTIRTMLETDTPTLDEFVSQFVRERGDLLERFRDRLALQQLRVMMQGLLDLCLRKGEEEFLARGWKAGKP